jgi:hypothetical protein
MRSAVGTLSDERTHHPVIPFASARECAARNLLRSAASHQPSGIGAPPHPRILMADR